MEQLGNRLHSISSNWREISCMEMLLTLILRLCSLASECTIAESHNLLEKARATTLLWTSQLRSEIQSATTAENSRRCSQYVFRSALLCRRSFAMYSAKAHDPEVLLALEEAELQCFIECSIALQDNMPSEPANLPLYYKNCLLGTQRWFIACVTYSVDLLRLIQTVSAMLSTEFGLKPAAVPPGGSAVPIPSDRHLVGGSRPISSRHYRRI